MDEQDHEQNITVNGITFTTKEAFARYREEHTFRVGDAVNVMTSEYSETKVCPGFITGISDFGEGKVSIDLVYFTDFGNMEFGEVFSDTCNAKSKITGIAPINEFNDLRMRLTDTIGRVESQINQKHTEIDGMERKLKTLRSFLNKTEQ